MSRIFEHDLADEEDVVARTLAVVHKAIDEAFPHIAHSNVRQFTTTAFSIQEETKAEQRPRLVSEDQADKLQDTRDSVPLTRDSVPLASPTTPNEAKDPPNESSQRDKALDQNPADPPTRSLSQYAALESQPPSQFTEIENSLNGVEGAFSMDESALLETDPNFSPIKQKKWLRPMLLLLILAALLGVFFYDVLVAYLVSWKGP